MSEGPRGGKDSRLDKDLVAQGRAGPGQAGPDGSDTHDDYAQFGLGLALARTGHPGAAAEHLALAAAMRPDLRQYTDAAGGVRATLCLRAAGGGKP